MRYFGINQGHHDGGVACFDDDGELLLFTQSERLTRKKSDGHVGSLADLLKKANLAPIDRSDLFFSTWPKFYPEFFYRQTWPLDFREGKRLAAVGFDTTCRAHFLHHHLSHIAASWLFRDVDELDESLYIAVDGMGVRSDGTEGFYSVGVISPTKISEHDHDLDKNIYSPHHRLNRVGLPKTSRIQIAGKLMGLAGYVPTNRLRHFSGVPSIGPINSRITLEGMTPELMIECASVYITYIHDLKRHLSTVLSRYAHTNVVIGGGAFLALELNTWLVEQGKTLVFAPPINDSGIALGSAAYGYFLANGRWPKRLTSPFLQWGPTETRENYLSTAEAAQYLSTGGILGVVAGKGEAGPRALGNRSFLAVPSRENAFRVSVEIKGREFYRPVAPIVTDRDFLQWFTGPRGRYMQYRNDCTPAAKIAVPGIVHNDNSARAQVLCHQDNPWLYEVMVNVGKLTGAECLINTSLNDQAHPICNTYADAIKELSHLPIQIIGF